MENFIWRVLNVCYVYYLYNVILDSEHLGNGFCVDVVNGYDDHTGRISYKVPTCTQGECILYRQLLFHC